MTTILYNDPELVIALKKRIVFVYPHDLQIFKSVEIPEDLVSCGLKVSSEESGETKKTIAETPLIQNVQLSVNREILAVTTSGQKALLIYKCFPVAVKLLSVRSLARVSTALAFNKNGDRLLVTDKTGDCWEYDCINVDKPPRSLLSHLAIVYVVLWSHSEEHIITCDRDDKIRVTHYPQSHDIHVYCLGHKEFVAGLAVLPQAENTLLSVSGDKTLRLWNYVSGEELAQIELPAPGIKFVMRQLDGNEYQVAVVLYQPNECIGIYNISREANGNGEWKISEHSLLTFAGIPSDLCFIGSSVYVAGVLDNSFKLFVAAVGEEQAKVLENWLTMVEGEFKDVKDWKLEDVSNWFKKRYDNVSDYLERKKRRIEDKINKT